MANQVDCNVITKTGFSLTTAYDAAKTAAQAGDAMTLTVGYGNALVAAVGAQVTADHGSGSYQTAAGFAVAGDAMTLTAGERDAVATSSLKLDWTGITGEALHSLLNAGRKLANKWTVSADGLTLTVYKEDGATTAYTQSVASTAGANPVTGLS